jgi:hypothetical protein
MVTDKSWALGVGVGVPYRVFALARGVALQPREGAAGVNVEEVGLRGLPDAHGNVEVPVLAGRKCVCQMPHFWKLKMGKLIRATEISKIYRRTRLLFPYGFN